jgi:hypothetical protein
MDQVRHAMFADDKFTKVLFLSFVLVALLLAAIGIYGVIFRSTTLQLAAIKFRKSRLSDKWIVTMAHQRQASQGHGLSVVGLSVTSRLFGKGRSERHPLSMIGHRLCFA